MADFSTEKIRMTVADYMRLPESSQHIELLDGELIIYGEGGMSPAAKDKHQETSSVFNAFLLTIFPARQIRTAPTDVHIDGFDVIQPDLFWIDPERGQCVLGEDGYLHGAPDFIIEIISPSTAARDRGYKYELYERCGVREYWIVDPVAEFIEVYIQDGGKFKRLGLFIPGQTFQSPLLNGRDVTVRDLFE